MKVAYDIALESMIGHPDARLPKRSDNGWVYLCPAHDAVDYGGWIADNKKKPGGPPELRCLTGCSPKEIEKALKQRGLWFWTKEKREKGDENLERKFIAGWLYTDRDAARTPVLRVSHWDYFTPGPDAEFVKTAIVRQKPDDKGNWIPAPFDYAAPPYNWLAVREKAFHNKAVFCVDGEDQVDLLTQWSLVGFCHDGGADSIWGFENSGVGQDCKEFGTEGVSYVVIIPDMNQAGMKCARAKARFLHKREIPVKLLCLPGLAGVSTGKGEGLRDWIRKGHTKEELLELAQGCELWPPDDDEDFEYIPDTEPTKAEIMPAVPVSEDDEDPFKAAFTDLGNALWFKRLCKDFIIFLPEGRKGGVWMIYTQGIWRFDNASIVKTWMAKAVDYMQREMAASGRYPSDKILDWRNKSLSNRGISAALSLAQGRMKTDESSFDQAKWLLPCISGVIDLKTGELLAHDPKYRWTKRIDLEYDPKVEVSYDDAPNFTKFMLSIFPDEDKKKQWQKIFAVVRCFAVSLTGDPKFRKWFLLYGSLGREGKSTIAEFVLFMLGLSVFGITARKSLICEVQQESKFSNPGILKAMRYCIMDEIGKKDKIDNEKMKSITGNDTITGDKVYVDAFSFAPSHYLYVYGNSRPRFDAGGDPAAQDRCVVIPFLRHFEEHEIDDELPANLRKEVKQVFAIFIWACVDIWQNKSLRLHSFMLEAKEQYLKEEDLFGQFLEQCIQPIENMEVTAEELHDTLVWWCRAEQGMNKPWHKSTMGKELSRRGYKSRKDLNGYMLYLDIQIKPSCIARQKYAKHRQQVIEYS